MELSAVILTLVAITANGVERRKQYTMPSMKACVKTVHHHRAKWKKTKVRYFCNDKQI